jgi:hypothetical protein
MPTGTTRYDESGNLLPNGQTREFIVESQPNEPAPVSDTTGQVPRYTGQPTTADEAATARYARLATPVDEEGIRAREMQAVQAELDAITAASATAVKREQAIGEENLGQTRATASARGVLGSPFGTSALAKSKAETEESVQTVEQKRDLVLAQTRDKAKARADALIATEKGQKFSLQAEQINYLTNKEALDRQLKVEHATAAKEDVGNVAASGVDYDAWKGTDTYLKIQKELGYSDEEIKGLFMSKVPQDKIVSSQTVGNKVIFFTQGNDGKIKSTEMTIDVPVDTNVEYTPQFAPDGTLLLVPKKFDSTKDINSQILVKGNYAKTEAPKNNETPAEKSATNQAKLDVLNDKISTVDLLKTHPGMGGTVGVYGVSRWTPFNIDKADRVEFAGYVHQLTSKETLDFLVNLKAQGGTLGALNASELDILKGSATKINDWEIKDEKGNGTGRWQVSEESFKKELDQIKKITERAKVALLKGSSNLSDTGTGGQNQSYTPGTVIESGGKQYKIGADGQTLEPVL